MGRVGGLLRQRDGANADFDIVRAGDLLPAGEYDLRDSRPMAESAVPGKAGEPRSLPVPTRRSSSATASQRVASPSASRTGSLVTRGSSVRGAVAQSTTRTAGLPAGLRREFVHAHALHAGPTPADDTGTGRLRARWGTVVNPREHFPEVETPRSDQFAQQTTCNVQHVATVPSAHAPINGNRRSLDAQQSRGGLGYPVRADHHETNSALPNHCALHRTATHRKPPRDLTASAPSSTVRSLSRDHGRGRSREFSWVGEASDIFGTSTSSAAQGRSRSAVPPVRSTEPAVSASSPLLSGSNDTFDCPICLEDVALGHRALQLTPCHHLFHEECLIRCAELGEPFNCPLCRTVIRTSELTAIDVASLMADAMRKSMRDAEATPRVPEVHTEVPHKSGDAMSGGRLATKVCFVCSNDIVAGTFFQSPRGRRRHAKCAVHCERVACGQKTLKPVFFRDFRGAFCSDSCGLRASPNAKFCFVCDDVIRGTYYEVNGTHRHASCAVACHSCRRRTREAKLFKGLPGYYCSALCGQRAAQGAF
jgi:hypothetical protein